MKAIISEIKNYLGEDWLSMQGLMKEALSTDIGLLKETNSNILERSGKQLRPMIALLIARVTGAANIEKSVRYAAATELLHNATLLHDDVADQSDTRRGAPTIKSLLGGPAAVLVGDFWLSKAMDMILRTPAYDKVIGLFSKTLSELAEGEMLQLQKAMNADTSIDDYIRIIHCKTASLFETACVSSARAADASEEQINATKEYAVNLGIAFQIKDDIMDYSSSSEIGKPVGVDLKEGKITLPLLCALSVASEEAGREVRKMVLDIPSHPGNVGKIFGFVDDKNGLQLAKARLYEFVDRAKNALEAFPRNQAADYLEALAEYVADRQL